MNHYTKADWRITYRGVRYQAVHRHYPLDFQFYWFNRYESDLISYARTVLLTRFTTDRPLADRLTEYKGLDQCPICDSYAECDCPKCSNCDERCASTCNECNNCNDCCECVCCAYCEEPTESVCEACNNCDDHCDCWYCHCCETRISSGSCRSQCENCENCSDCCECYYCESCESQTTHICDECERCGDCCNCNRCVKDYGTDVLDYLQFIGNPKDHTFYGIELEVQVKRSHEYDSISERVSSLLDGFVVLKRDSSIGNDGFEIVTAPADLESHRDRWSAFWSNQPQKHLTSWKSGECGMHVHISRPSQLVVGKMLCFLNSTENGAFITTVAGRGDTGYTKRDPSKKITDCNKPYSGAGRYSALNLINEKTVELRIFRGTLKESSFWKNLEFTHALVHFCRQTSIKVLSVEAFCKFITQPSQRKQYSHLISFLAQKQYLHGVKITSDDTSEV